MLKGLDHLVVAVRDLDEAQDRWTRLGFTVTPRGRHTELKTANHTIMFKADDYIELLGVEEQRPANAHYAEFLRRREGLAALALKTDDARGAMAPLTAAGFPVTEAVDFGRPVQVADGTRDARFTISQIDPAATPGGRVFLCQHHTRDLVWRPEYVEHANTAAGLAALVIAADDPQPVAESYARLFGGTVEAQGPALLVRTGDTPIVVATPAALHWVWTSDPAFETVPRPFLAGAVVRVTDLEKAQQCLQKGKFPTVVGNGVLRVGSAAGNGMMLAFATRFDLPALIP
ncbi:VOC family protein [Azospirillum thermophilum]|uniref:VOC family protein n=1 Tax=Azospirillum thermophilum TaxID=2202148 RepID=A0A2S2CQU3_9PROT|nr:VOC family protein [Azospirillum thermophilum]AWK86881.1 VOC family protein [Azospirillum thermophilum]